GVTGHLAQSFGGGEFGGTELLGQTLDTIQGRVFSSLPYAIVMDQGRQPGARMPPVDALLLWVERVFEIPGGFDDDELESVAWAVARSIARKGIPGRHFVDQGVTATLPRVDAILEAMAAEIAAVLTNTSAPGRSGGPGGGGLL